MGTFIDDDSYKHLYEDKLKEFDDLQDAYCKLKRDWDNLVELLPKIIK